LISDTEHCIFQEKEKSKIHDELLKFIKDTKVKLNIVFPEHVDHFLISKEITNTIASKKLKDNINTKLLYSYNENTKTIIKRISPFVLLKRLEFSVNDSYIFLRDDHDFFIIGPNKLSLHKLINSKKYDFNNVLNEDNQKNIEVVDSLYVIYSKNNSLLSLITSFYNSLWFQKETFDNMVEEKSHSDLLVDLISHDIGNHHSIVQAATELTIDMVQQKLSDYDNPNMNLPSSNTNSKNISHYDFNKKSHINIDKVFLQEILSHTLIIQSALVRSHDLVKNILKLERMYRQKEVRLVSINIIEALEEAKQIFENKQNIDENNASGNIKRLELNIIFPGQCRKEDISIMGDDLLKEVFINLFSNAIKYSNKSDNVVKIDVSITDYVLSSANYWMISVADYGQGIPESVKENLFERFYSKASGTGLGLSIVRALVERYNGRVWISDRMVSSYKEGASIGMMFPKPQSSTKELSELD
jgi:hypothetical protein